MTIEGSRLTPAQAEQRITHSVRAIVELARPRSDAELQREPDDSWSAARVLAHVGEMLPYWARQAREVAGRDGPGAPFGRTHDDRERIGAVGRHANDPKDRLLQAIESAEREALAALHEIGADRWSRTATHARRGEMSVTQIVQQFLVDHLEEHRAQLAHALSSEVAS